MNFSRVAGGLLTGLGKGVELQAEQQQKQADNEALLRRQMALARYGNDLDIQKEGVMQSDRLALTDREARNKIITTGAELQTRGALDQANDARTAAREAANQQRAFQIWKMQQPIELRNKLTLQDFIESRQDTRSQATQAAESGRSVAGRGTDANGDLVVAFPDGRTQSYHGVKPLQSGASSLFDDYGDGTDGAGGTSGGRRGLANGVPAASPAPAPAASPPANTYTVDQYRQTLADAAMDPRFKGQSADQIKKTVDKALRDRGLRLAPNGG
jgi:hypothetical protein